MTEPASHLVKCRGLVSEQGVTRAGRIGIRGISWDGSCSRANRRQRRDVSDRSELMVEAVPQSLPWSVINTVVPSIRNSLTDMSTG